MFLQKLYHRITTSAGGTNATKNKSKYDKRLRELEKQRKVNKGKLKNRSTRDPPFLKIESKISFSSPRDLTLP